MKNALRSGGGCGAASDRSLRWLACAAIAGAWSCGTGDSPPDGGTPPSDSDIEDGDIDHDGDEPDRDGDASDAETPDEDPPPPPWDTLPCEGGRYWPRRVESSSLPVLVHYRLADEEPMAREVLRLLEISWRVEIEELGFSPPLDDGGTCGPDGRFDVFLWRDYEECYVDVLDVNPATDWNDWTSFMLLDPWGPYGGEHLDATVSHELNHGCQAADDWWESEVVFEATATFIEDVVFDEDNEYLEILCDFQGRPDWSLDFNDDYETWYMYGAALYLHYLRERFFDGDAGFVAEMWRRSRNPHGSEYDPARNEPDFEDALDDLLRTAAGVGFIETVTEFARWRWYTGSRDDGRHFEEGALFPADALVASIGPVTATPGRVEIVPAPMMLGNAYVDLIGAPNALVSFTLETDEPLDAEWVLQAVPGLDEASDGERVDMRGGVGSIELDGDGSRTLVLTVVPSDADDPDTRPERRFRATLVIE